MDWIRLLFSHLTEASQSPLGLTAYAIGVIAAAVVALAFYRNQTLQRAITGVPGPERVATIEALRDEPIPKDISAEEWLRGRRNRYIFSAFCVVALTVVAIVAIAVLQRPKEPDWSGRMGWAYYEESNGSTTEDGVFRPVGAKNSPHFEDLHAGVMLKSVHSFRLRETANKDATLIGTVGGGACANVMELARSQPPFRPIHATSGGKIRVQIEQCP